MNTKENNKKLGNLGEDIASKFLIKRGYSILDRNYLKKCGELDIVAKKANKLHFIEVKSVSCETIPDVSHETNQETGFRPEDNVHEWKLQRLSKTIQIYITEKNVSSETEWQFDVITVYIDKKRLISKVNMLENVII